MSGFGTAQTLSPCILELTFQSLSLIYKMRKSAPSCIITVRQMKQEIHKSCHTKSFTLTYPSLQWVRDKAREATGLSQQNCILL